MVLGQTSPELPHGADYFAHYNKIPIIHHTHSTVVEIYINDLRI